MSSLYKSGSIVLGDPLEIKADISLAEKECAAGEPETDPPKGNCEQNEAECILEAAREKAALIINEAEERSREILERAQHEGYKKGYEEGKQKGLAEGLDRGRRQGLATADKMIEEAVEIKRRALEKKENMVKEAEAEVVRIVMEIARKVLGEQIRIDRDTVLEPARKALEKCTFSSRATMKVSPDDYDVVELNKKRLLAEVEGITQLEIVVEDTLPQGSCLLETEAGYIDSGVEVQLDRIEHTFRELLNYE